MRNVAPLTLQEFETQPFRISGSARLDADPSSVFADLGDPALWFPLMRRTVWMTASPGGVGAEREIDHRIFGRGREHMVAWTPGERMAFTMTKLDSPFIDRFGEEWLLRRDGTYTDVTWIVVATPTRLGSVAKPILRRLLQSMFTRGCTNLGKRAGSFKGKQVS